MMNSQGLHITQTRSCVRAARAVVVVVVVAQRPCERQMERQAGSRKDTWLNTAVTKHDDGTQDRDNLRTPNISPALSCLL